MADTGDKTSGLALPQADRATHERSQQAVSAVPVGIPSAGRPLEAAIETMGGRVEARRKAMGLSLEQLAERAGMSKSHVWEIESGKSKNPTIRTTFHIARALGWTLSDVIGMWEHADLLHPEAMRVAVQVDWLIRSAQGIETRQGGDGTAPSQGDESPVPNGGCAPTPARKDNLP